MKILFIVNLVLGILMIIGGLWSIKAVGFYSVFTIMGGLFIIFLSFVGKESGEVVVDIADSVIENNAKKK